uniref:Prokaryotic-type class I peptide chain release factors domain-containing protein n=1 Tax=Anguilla anguilla TaxID=7936 RepID=A0A0E9PBN3_ANGAN
MAASIMRRLYLTLCVSGTPRVHVPNKYGLHYRIVDREYRSAYRLIKLNYGSKAEVYTQDGQIHIPVDRSTISYSRSSGPGGQHVNKGDSVFTSLTSLF